MRTAILLGSLVIAGLSIARAGDDKSPDSPNTRQYASVKLGYYQPGSGLNNGLLLGIDGITEFVHYNATLSAAVDLYPKQEIDIFSNPQPNGGTPPAIDHQQMILLPIHVNIGYKLFEVSDADLRCYGGIGGGYYLYFYSIDYHSSSGGLLGGVLNSSSDSKSGGNIFGTAFVRLVIDKVFLEPRLYAASKVDDSVGGYSYEINPSGYSITVGFQYH